MTDAQVKCRAAHERGWQGIDVEPIAWELLALRASERRHARTLKAYCEAMGAAIGADEPQKLRQRVIDLAMHHFGAAANVLKSTAARPRKGVK